jgi:capsular polysaccharide biosynthesis protein
VLSIFLGALLGIGFALVAEMFDRRVRSADDLKRLLDMPVLGELSRHAIKKFSLKNSISQFFNQKTGKKRAFS